MPRGRPLVAAAAATAAIALIAACSSSKKQDNNGGNTGGNGSNSSSGSSGSLGPRVINGSYTQKGGTINVLMSDNFNHLDPVQNYVSNSSDVGRLIYRTLTLFDDNPANPTPKIVSDIAVKSGPKDYIGIPNKDLSVWTYKIQHGLKFQDGTPITAADIKYNIERSFAQDIYKDGATYMPDTLQNPNGYKGPYKDPNKDLTSVQTPDPYTLVFHFQGPQPDADMMMSLFYTAPVPKAKDTKQNYDFQPVASGPYMIQHYTPDKQLVLVRNPNWDPKTDPNRPALPDKFVFTIGIAPATIGSRLIADTGDDQTALSIDNSSDIEAGDIAKLRAPDVKSRFVNGSGQCVGYEYLDEQTIKDADVRHAIAMALNRQAIITALNGLLFGSIPTSFIAPSVRGYQPANLGLKDTGDIAGAKALLAGKDYPKTITYAVSASRPVQHAVGVQVQSDLAKLGITVKLVNIPTKTYYATLRHDPGPADMGVAIWCSDWPTMASIVPPVLGPDSSGKTWSTNNFSKYYDPATAKQITDLASSTESTSQVDQQFAQLANQIQTTNWPLVPIQLTLNPMVVGSKIRNAGVSTIWNLPDLNTIGVAP